MTPCSCMPRFINYQRSIVVIKDQLAPLCAKKTGFRGDFQQVGSKVHRFQIGPIGSLNRNITRSSPKSLWCGWIKKTELWFRRQIESNLGNAKSKTLLEAFFCNQWGGHTGPQWECGLIGEVGDPRHVNSSIKRTISTKVNSWACLILFYLVLLSTNWEKQHKILVVVNVHAWDLMGRSPSFCKFSFAHTFFCWFWI